MESLSLSVADGVATLTIDRQARKNALTGEDWKSIPPLMKQVASDDRVRVLVVTGAGGEFCAGADLSAPGRAGEAPLVRMRSIAEAAESLYRLPKPTIAKVDGVAVGAGCNLALCCDLVAASSRARFSEIFSKRGLSLDFGGSWLLPRIIGMQKAKRLAFFGDLVDAAEAQRLGLVTEVVEVSALDGLVDAWARRLAAGPPIALALTKSLLDASGACSFEQALAAEAHAQAINLASADAREAMRAFVEKREPVFEGR